MSPIAYIYSFIFFILFPLFHRSLLICDHLLLPHELYVLSVRECECVLSITHPYWLLYLLHTFILPFLCSNDNKLKILTISTTTNRMQRGTLLKRGWYCWSMNLRYFIATTTAPNTTPWWYKMNMCVRFSLSLSHTTRSWESTVHSIFYSRVNQCRLEIKIKLLSIR